MSDGRRVEVERKDEGDMSKRRIKRMKTRKRMKRLGKRKETRSKIRGGEIVWGGREER